MSGRASFLLRLALWCGGITFLAFANAMSSAQHPLLHFPIWPPTFSLLLHISFPLSPLKSYFGTPTHTPRSPPQHDESFLIMTGTRCHHGKDNAHVDTGVGGDVVVSPRSPHAFSNPLRRRGQVRRNLHASLPHLVLQAARYHGRAGQAGESQDQLPDAGVLCHHRRHGRGDGDGKV